MGVVASREDRSLYLAPPPAALPKVFFTAHLTWKYWAACKLGIWRRLDTGSGLKFLGGTFLLYLQWICQATPKVVPQVVLGWKTLGWWTLEWGRESHHWGCPPSVCCVCLTHAVHREAVLVSAIASIIDLFSSNGRMIGWPQFLEFLIRNMRPLLYPKRLSLTALFT